MRVDTIVAAGCSASYLATAVWASQSGAIVEPYATVVGVKDIAIAGLCGAWAIAEWRRGPARARVIALIAALVILADAVLALVGGAGPWRTDISPDGSFVASLLIGVGLVAAGLALVWFVRRPDPPGAGT
jgi:hypothetical protein